MPFLRRVIGLLILHHLALLRVSLKIVDLFDKFDEDRSGELSINEMRTLLFQSDVRTLPWFHVA